MNRFAELLDRLAYEPGRNNKLRLMTDYFRHTGDPERGYALAALTGSLVFQHAKPGVIRVLCDAHPHMFAWMVVHDSPYVTVTDDHGAFKLDGIPAGTYKVTMWHEGFRAKGVDKDGRPLYEDPIVVTKSVTIAPKTAATIQFELK